MLRIGPGRAPLRFEAFLHVLSHENVSNSELDQELAAVFGKLGIPVRLSSIALRPEFSLLYCWFPQGILSQLDKSILALLRRLIPAPKEMSAGTSIRVGRPEGQAT